MTSTPDSPKTIEPESTEPEAAQATDTVVEAEGDTVATPTAVFADKAEETVAAPVDPVVAVPPVGPGPVAVTDDEDATDDEELDELDLQPPPPPQSASLADAVLAVVGLLAAISVLLVAFGLPALKGGPHKVPIGVAGTPEITAQIKTLFSQGGSTSFSVRSYTDEAQMRKAITDRKIYGGLSVSTSAATMLVASGASETVAQSLNSVASNLASSGGIQIPVDDVVPLPSKDPRGAGFAAIALPLVIAGVLPGFLLLYRRFRSSLSTALATAFGYSLLSGFALGAILQFYFKSVDGNFLVTALSLSLGVAAIAFPLVGLGSIAGRIGVGIGAALMILLGYPLSGISTAPEWLSGFWSTIGAALPPGAAGTLLRSAAFFDGRGAGTSLIVLIAWTLGGLILVVIGTLLNPADPFEEELEPEPDSEPFPA